MGSVWLISLVGKHKRAQSKWWIRCTFAKSFDWRVLQSSGAISSSSGKRAVPPPLPYSLPPNSGSQLLLRLPEASGSSYSLHQHQQPLTHPRRIVSTSSGRSGGTSSVFPSSTVSGGSGSVSESHSLSMGGAVRRTPSGKVRQRSKARTRRSEDERRGQQGGATGLARLATVKTERRVKPIMDSQNGKLMEPTNGGGKSHNTRSLASALTAFDMHTLSSGTLSPTFSPVPINII